MGGGHQAMTRVVFVAFSPSEGPRQLRPQTPERCIILGTTSRLRRLSLAVLGLHLLTKGPLAIQPRPGLASTLYRA